MDIKEIKEKFPEPKDRIIYLLFKRETFAHTNLSYSIASLWEELGRPPKKWFLRKLEELQHLGLISIKSTGKRKEIKLTELGRIYGKLTALYDFIVGLASFTDFLNAYFKFSIRPKDVNKDLVVSEVIINGMWAILADASLEIIKAYIKSNYNEDIMKSSLNVLMHNLSHLLIKASEIVENKDVLFRSLDDARKQAQKEFLKYFIDKFNLKEFITYLSELKKRAPYEYKGQVEFLLRFLEHLIKVSVSLGIKP